MDVAAMIESNACRYLAEIRRWALLKQVVINPLYLGQSPLVQSVFLLLLLLLTCSSSSSMPITNDVEMPTM